MDLLVEGLSVTLFAMAIVFGVLVALMFIIKLQTAILSKDKPKASKPIEKAEVKQEVNVKPAVEPKKDNTDEELVAVIMSAISAYSDMQGIDFTIKSIKRVSTNDSGWRRAGLN